MKDITEATADESRRSASVQAGLIIVLSLIAWACGGAGPSDGTGSTGQAPPEAPQTAQAQGDSSRHEVRLGPEAVQQLGIRVEQLYGGSARSVVARPATLMLDPDRTALVGPRLGSKVVRVVKDLGDLVQEGDTLAVMSSTELGREKAAFLTARARFNTAEATYRREEGLFRQSITSEADLLEAEALYREAEAEVDAAREDLRLHGMTAEEIESIEPGGDVLLSYFPLRSPISGRVQQRDVAPGQTVTASETPIHVANMSRLWVMIDAYDQDVPNLETGQRVNLSVRSLPGREFQGIVDWISLELEPESRTVQVRAIVDNPAGALRGGMYGTARLNLSEDVSRALVPVDAVQTLEGRTVVFVPGLEEGLYLAQPVELGAESESGMVEIVSGLLPGDSAVVAGAFDLMSAATAGARSADHSH